MDFEIERSKIIAEVFNMEIEDTHDFVALPNVTIGQIERAMSLYKNAFLDELKQDGHTFTYWGGETDYDSYDYCKDELPARD